MKQGLGTGGQFIRTLYKDIPSNDTFQMYASFLSHLQRYPSDQITILNVSSDHKWVDLMLKSVNISRGTCI